MSPIWGIVAELSDPIPQYCRWAIARGPEIRPFDLLIEPACLAVRGIRGAWHAQCPSRNPRVEPSRYDGINLPDDSGSSPMARLGDKRR